MFLLLCRAARLHWSLWSTDNRYRLAWLLAAGPMAGMYDQRTGLGSAWRRNEGQAFILSTAERATVAGVQATTNEAAEIVPLTSLGVYVPSTSRHAPRPQGLLGQQRMGCMAAGAGVHLEGTYQVGLNDFPARSKGRQKVSGCPADDPGPAPFLTHTGGQIVTHSRIAWAGLALVPWGLAHTVRGTRKVVRRLPSWALYEAAQTGGSERRR
jgi:hypothetical protein